MTKKEIFNLLNSGIDKNGNLKKNGGFKKHFPDIYEEYLNTQFPNEIELLPFKQKLWHFLNDVYEMPKCQCCGGNVGFETKSGKWGYRKFCSGKCAMNDESTKNKIKKVFIEKYGVDSYSKTDEYKNKVKSTNIEKYGVDSYSKTDEYKNKVKSTNIEKYGVDSYSKTDECKNKVKSTNIERYGVDNYAKTDECKDKVKSTNIERYGVDNYAKTDECKEKTKCTNIERYGIDNYAKTDECKDKIKSTNIEKYGAEHYNKSEDYKSNIENIKRKIRETCFEKYGTYYYTQSNEYKNKKNDIISETKKTNIEKYGVDSYSKTDECKERVKNTSMEKYGVDNYAKTDESKEKSYQTKKLNKSFNSSSIEESFGCFLENMLIDFKRQYKSDLYPFSCDFYIPSIDLYIEIQGTWTHGYHPFDKDNIDDFEKLNLWKEKNSPYYEQAIYTWSELDVRKRKIALDNKLNYLEIFSDNIDECISIFYDYIISLLSNWCLKNKLPGNSKWASNHPIWSCNVGNRMSPMSAWSNEKMIKKAVKNMIHMASIEENLKIKYIGEFLKCTITDNEITKSSDKLLQYVLDRFTIAKIAPKVTAISSSNVKKIIDESGIDISNGVYVPMAGFGGIIEGSKKWADEHQCKIDIEAYDINEKFCNWYGWIQKDMLSQKIKTDKVCICCPPFGKSYEHWEGTPKEMSDIDFKEWYKLIKEYIDAPNYIIIGPETSRKNNKTGLFSKKYGVMIWTDDMVYS